MKDYRLLLTKDEAAKRLGVAKEFVAELVNRQELKIVQIRDRYRIPLVQIERWIEKNSKYLIGG